MLSGLRGLGLGPAGTGAGAGGTEGTCEGTHTDLQHPLTALPVIMTFQGEHTIGAAVRIIGLLTPDSLCHSAVRGATWVALATHPDALGRPPSDATSGPLGLHWDVTGM